MVRPIASRPTISGVRAISRMNESTTEPVPLASVAPLPDSGLLFIPCELLRAPAVALIVAALGHLEVAASLAPVVGRRASQAVDEVLTLEAATAGDPAELGLGVAVDDPELLVVAEEHLVAVALRGVVRQLRTV